MNYLPMLAGLHPNRVLIFFVYVGAVVEGITAAGAAKRAAAGLDIDKYKSWGTHRGRPCPPSSGRMSGSTRCGHGTLPRRASEHGAHATSECSASRDTAHQSLSCDAASFAPSKHSRCSITSAASRTALLSSVNEWYLYAFELGPVLIFTYWLNLLHPGRFLLRNKSRYLGTDGRIERIGPGWIDHRSQWETFLDPLDIEGMIKGQPSHEKYWLPPRRLVCLLRWELCRGRRFEQDERCWRG